MTTVLGYTHVVKQLSFSMFHSILGLGYGSTTVLKSTHVVEQLSFSMFPSTLAFDFDLMLGSFFTFGVLMGYFLG